MKITIIDAGLPKKMTLKHKLVLFDVGGNKNIAKAFIKKHARKACGDKKGEASPRALALSSSELTQAEFDEWEGILHSAKAGLLARHDYIVDPLNYVHPMIERELKQSYKKCLAAGIDKKFGLKNAMDAECAIFKRLTHGKISVKNPVNNKTHPNGAIMSDTLNFKHFRHTSDDRGDSWLMQIFCDFIMTMPDPKDSFEFNAGMEVEFQRTTPDSDIEFLDVAEFIFPISLSFKQEDFIHDVFHKAAHRKFVELGIKGGMPLETLNRGL